MQNAERRFMTALIIIGCILLFLAFILSLRATLIIAYNGEVSLAVKVLFVKITLFPKKDKKRCPHSMSAKKAERIKKKLKAKADKKKAKKREKAEEKQRSKEIAKEQGKKSLSEILEVVDLVKKLLAKVLKKFFKHLRIDLLRIKMKIALEDAASTAIAYGTVTQAINVIFPMLENIKNFKSPRASDINVWADFTSNTSDIDICIRFKLRVWHVLDVALGALFTYIKHKLKKSDKNQMSEGHKVSVGTQKKK